ncbi:MAG: hypothetical protein K6E72_04505 [Saccharofermentans sp.]|nr:hypothetical protein [Saccharofermentans sp.]
MLRYIIGITILTIGVIIVRALSNGKVFRKYQYVFWIAIPLYMILLPFVKIDVPVAEIWNNIFISKTETAIYEVTNNDSPAVIVDDLQIENDAPVNQTNIPGDNIPANETIREQAQIPDNNVAVSNVKANESKKIESVLQNFCYFVSAILVVVLIAYNIGFITYCKRKRKYLGKDPSSGLKIYGIKHKETPFLMFNKIYIDDSTESISKYIICHEACHYKHGDHLWVLIRYLILFLNWYNPVIWAAFILSGRDCELACDEAVMKAYGSDSSKEYARTLLEMLQQQSNITGFFSFSTGMKSGYELMKKRIISIKKPADNSRKALAFSLATILLVTSCSFANTSDTRKIKSSDPWFSSQITKIDDKYKDLKLDYFTRNILGAYKDGVLIETEGSLQSKTDSHFINLDYYAFTGELIKSIDISKVRFNREIDNITINDDGIDLRLHDTVRPVNSNETNCYLVKIDPETGTVGELEELENIPYDSQEENPINYEDSWTIGDYTVSWYRKAGTLSFAISKEGNSKFVDLIGDPHFSSINYFKNYIPVSETEILLVCSSNDVSLISLNLETGEIKNEDEEYSWLKNIKYETCLSSFDGKTYFKDQYGVKVINFASKELEEVFSYNSCNVNRKTLIGMDLLSVKDNKYVFAGMIKDSDLLTEFDRELIYVPTIIVLEKTEKNPNAGKTMLLAATVGRTDLEYSICEAIRVFNETNGDYFVLLENKLSIADYIDYSDAKNHDEIMDIYYNGASALGNQLVTDILSGNGPDIILYADDFRLIQSEEYLLDLSRYIKGKNGINEADYFSNVISASKIDDKLLYMPVSFTVSGIETDKSNVSNGQLGFTFDEYTKFVNEICNGADPMNQSQLEAICTLYSYMSDTCIDGKIVNFDNESFRALCDYVKNNVNDKSFSMCTNAEDTWYPDFRNFLIKNGFNAKNMTLLGYPSTDGRGPVISVQTSIGISTSAPSVVADGAWEFIRICMSDEIQNVVATQDSNPMSISAFESSAILALEKFNKNNTFVQPLDDTVITSYKNVLLSASVIDNNDPAVLIVIREEVPPFFVDQKSLDAVLPIINDRVSTIIAERT